MISKCSCVFVLSFFIFDFKITAVFLMPGNSGTRASPPELRPCWTTASSQGPLFQ
jgi:hypothetical protein